MASTEEAARSFSTIGNWRQTKRPVEYEGRVYRWSKHAEFLKIIDLPKRTQARIAHTLATGRPLRN